MERETEETWSLDEEQKHRVRAIQRFGKRGLDDFVVSYYVEEGAETVELVTYDCAHGEPHRHLRYLPSEEKRSRTVLDAKPFRVLVDDAVSDIVQNWPRYYAEYRRRLEFGGE